MTIDTEKIRDLESLTTPGPWRVGRHVGRTLYRDISSDPARSKQDPLIGVMDFCADTRFVAMSRTYIPALCDEVDRLRRIEELATDFMRWLDVKDIQQNAPEGSNDKYLSWGVQLSDSEAALREAIGGA